MPSKGSRSSSKKAKKAGSNVFDMFSQKQVAEFKDGFQIIDRDRDGVLGIGDLRSMFDEIGRIASEDEINEMLGESDGPLNFTAFMTMFANKSSGEVDDDDVIAKAIRAFETEPSEIDSENFRLMLMSFGQKFTSKEVDDVFANVEMDEETGIIDGDALVAMLASASSEEEA